MPGAAWPWKKMMSPSPAVVAAEEMIEADFVQRRGRGIRRDVAADALLGLVGADDHRGRVPADEALDAALEVGAAGHERLLVGGDRVDVRRVGGERQLDAVLSARESSARGAAGRLSPGRRSAARNRANRAIHAFRRRRARRHLSELYVSQRALSFRRLGQAPSLRRRRQCRPIAVALRCRQSLIVTLTREGNGSANAWPSRGAVQ